MLTLQRAVALATAILCGTVSGAEASIKFCNQFPYQVYVAMSYPQASDSWVSRGWLSLPTGQCALFDTALNVKTFYYRAESVDYRDKRGVNVKMEWGTSDRQFAIWEDANFNYWDAQQKVLNSKLVPFSLGATAEKGDLSITVTFLPGGRSMKSF